MSYLLFIIFFVFITGICIGSFLNVVILRAFSNESIVFPSSKCPKCQHPLKWYHNIPILSYIMLGGKCAFCGEKISIQYPIIELLTGLIFLLMFFKYGLSLQSVFAWYFSALFIVLAVTDIKEKVIFTRHAYFLAGGALLYNLLNLNPLFHGSYNVFGIPVFVSVINSILGLLLGIVIMEILARVGYLFAGTRAFGEGDTYIAAGMGVLFGWRLLVLAIILSVIIQLFFTIPLFLIKLLKNKEYKTIFASVIFVIMLLLYSYLPLVLSTVLLVLSAGWLCYLLLKDLNKSSDMMYLAFGPAMILASFIIILLI